MTRREKKQRGIQGEVNEKRDLRLVGLREKLSGAKSGEGLQPHPEKCIKSHRIRSDWRKKVKKRGSRNRPTVSDNFLLDRRKTFFAKPRGKKIRMSTG